MRRLFIIRKDLNLSAGKLAAMVGHCCEAYWTNLLKRCSENKPVSVENGKINMLVDVDENVWYEYVLGIFTKTICQADNLNQLKKAELKAMEMGLVQGIDWGYINDCCLTELTPENEDGTTTIGIWFKPLSDDVAHTISKKYKLYGAFEKKRNCDVYKTYDEAFKEWTNFTGNLYEISHTDNKALMSMAEWMFEPYTSHHGEYIYTPIKEQH